MHGNWLVTLLFLGAAICEGYGKGWGWLPLLLIHESVFNIWYPRGSSSSSSSPLLQNIFSEMGHTLFRYARVDTLCSGMQGWAQNENGNNKNVVLKMGYAPA